MDTSELRDWWEETDGEGEDEEYPHHPADVYETEWGLGVVLCLPEDDDEAYQDGESASPDYVLAVQNTLAVLFEEQGSQGRFGSRSTSTAGPTARSGSTAAFWESDQLVQSRLTHGVGAPAGQAAGPARTNHMIAATALVPITTRVLVMFASSCSCRFTETRWATS